MKSESIHSCAFLLFFLVLSFLHRLFFFQFLIQFIPRLDQLVGRRWNCLKLRDLYSVTSPDTSDRVTSQKNCITQLGKTREAYLSSHPFFWCISVQLWLDFNIDTIKRINFWEGKVPAYFIDGIYALNIVCDLHARRSNGRRLSCGFLENLGQSTTIFCMINRIDLRFERSFCNSISY